MPWPTLLALLAQTAGSASQGYVEGKMAKEKLDEAKEMRDMQKKLLQLKIDEQKMQQGFWELIGGLGATGQPEPGQPLAKGAGPALTPQQYEGVSGLPAPAGPAPVGPAPATPGTPSVPIRQRMSLTDLLTDPGALAALKMSGVADLTGVANAMTSQQRAQLEALKMAGAFDTVQVPQPDGSIKTVMVPKYGGGDVSQGNVIGAKPPDLVPVKTVGPDGREITTFVNPHGMGGGPGFQTGLPPTEDFTYEDPNSGQKMSVIRNKITGEKLTTPVPVEGVKPPSGESSAGRIVMAIQATDFLRQLQEMLFKDGKLDRTLVMQMNAPFGGIGKGRKAIAIFDDAIDARVRASTGAAISKEELPYYRHMYLPSPLDSDATATDKLKRAIGYADNLVSTMDPEGRVRKRLPAKPSTVGTEKTGPTLKKKYTLIPVGD